MTALLTLRGFHSRPCDAQQAGSGSAAGQKTPPAPWTPTRELTKRKWLPKRMAHLLQVRPGPGVAALPNTSS